MAHIRSELAPMAHSIAGSAALRKPSNGEHLALVAGGIAHDCNNLLATVLGNAELALLDLPPESPARASLAQITAAARRAGDLTQRLLRYATPDSNVHEIIDLNTLVREIGALLSVSLPPNTRLQYDLPPKLPLLQGDPTQIEQVVMNLMINAAEALAGRAGTITVRTSIQRPSADEEMPPGVDTRERPLIMLTVTDTGDGMLPEVQARMFEPYFTTKRRGRGLGLALVRTIVQEHGGTIAVTSIPGHGTTLALCFPGLIAQDGDDMEQEMLQTRCVGGS